MKNSKNSLLEISFLGQYLQLKCPLEQQEILKITAKEIEDRVLQMKERSRILSTERVLAVVALNLALELKQEQHKQQSVEDTLALRIQQIDSSLEKFGLIKTSD